MKVQIILAGLGGQGILFASKLFSELGLKLNLNVMGSETHGMSQRGGSVIAHLKLGNFESPMIRTGTADFLYSLEKDETYRTLKFLKSGGRCFANLSNPDSFDKKVMDYLKKQRIIVKTCDASGIASQIGSIVAANIVLIGYSVGTGLVPFKYKDLREVLESVSRKKNCIQNLRAFDAGMKEGKLVQEAA
ncbi:MAG: indolepyruvate oxidoreductase subunit beta [Candidatus Aminicenantaceae bacterium]